MLARLVAQSKSRPDVALGRALFVAAFIGFWMLIVVARLVHLQFSQHETLAERAKQQQQNAIETTAQRGELLDRRTTTRAQRADCFRCISIRKVSTPQNSNAPRLKSHARFA